MNTVVIQVPSPDDREPPQSLELGPGQSATFGRGALGTANDITLQHPGISRLAGEITAVGDYWALTNFSGQKT